MATERVGTDRPIRRTTTSRSVWTSETKPFFLTSEFLALVVTGIVLAIHAAGDDAIDQWRLWILLTALVGVYILSRGIAKAGSRSPSYDPREDATHELRDRS